MLFSNFRSNCVTAYSMSILGLQEDSRVFRTSPLTLTDAKFLQHMVALFTLESLCLGVIRVIRVVPQRRLRWDVIRVVPQRRLRWDGMEVREVTQGPKVATVDHPSPPGSSKKKDLLHSQAGPPLHSHRSLCLYQHSDAVIVMATEHLLYARHCS